MSKQIVFSSKAWEDYQYWINSDPKIAIKINKLIKDIERDPFQGLGKPEALKYAFSGWWSRRIDQENRLIYKFQNDSIVILNCRYHYC